MKKIIVIILLSFICISCNEKQIVENENNSGVNSFFPAKIGNYWIYVDSVTINNVLEVSRDTIIIIGTENVDNQKWWKLNHSCIAIQPIGEEFLIRNDSVFSKQPCWGGVFFPGLAFIPITSGVKNFVRPHGCDAGISVQATFIEEEYNEFSITSKNYILYEENIGLETNVSKFIQGIGVVKTLKQGTITGSGPFKIISTLIEYKNN